MEMEAAALFAVAQIRDVALASLLVVDGAFGDPIARPQFDRGAAYGRLFGLLPIVVETLQ